MSQVPVVVPLAMQNAIFWIFLFSVPILMSLERSEGDQMFAGTGWG